MTQLALFTFAYLFLTQSSDLHRFPNERYALDTYWGIGLSMKDAQDDREYCELHKCREAWSVLHSAWVNEGHRRYLMQLRFLIGVRAYERGEMPAPPVRIVP